MTQGHPPAGTELEWVPQGMALAGRGGGGGLGLAPKDLLEEPLPA